MRQEDMKRKVSMTLSPKQDDYTRQKAKEMGINRSALIAICIDNFMKSQEMMEGIKDMSTMMKQLQQMQAIGNPIDVNSQDQ